MTPSEFAAQLLSLVKLSSPSAPSPAETDRSREERGDFSMAGWLAESHPSGLIHSHSAPDWRLIMKEPHDAMLGSGERHVSPPCEFPGMETAIIKGLHAILPLPSFDGMDR